MDQESPPQVSWREGWKKGNYEFPNRDHRGKIKESVEVYEDGNNEQLLQKVRDFKNFVDTYNLFTEHTKDTWDKLIRGETLIEENFDIHLNDLITDELGAEAFKYQVKYLKKNKAVKESNTEELDEKG